MAEQQPTWGSMIWGAAKTVGIVAVTAVVGTALLNNIGSFLAGNAGEIANTAAGAAGAVGAGAATTGSVAATATSTASNVGQWMQGASEFLGHQIHSVVGTVVTLPDGLIQATPGAAGPSINTFGEIGKVAGQAFSNVSEWGGKVVETIGNNPGTAAAVGATGLGIGYMIRGAEAGTARTRPVVGSHTAQLARQQQLAALAAAQGHA